MPSKTKRRQPGDGALYRRADGLWVGAVDLGIGGDGKRRRRVVSGKTQTAALAKLREVRREIEQGVGRPAKSMTTGAWLQHWLEHVAKPRLRPGTFDGYSDDVRLHIAPAVGAYRLDKLGPQHVRAMSQQITGKGRSSTTALRCHRILSKALTDAHREGHVTRNVASLVDAPRKAVSSRGALTADQGRRLLETINGDAFASRWWAALVTGARQGELLGLERDRVADAGIDVSWQLQRLRYRHGCGATCGRQRAGSCPLRELDVPHGFEYRPLHGGLALTRPKTNAGWRVIPLVDPLRTTLLAHIAATDPGPHGLVWHTDGRPIDARDDSQAWHAILDRAGVPSVPLHAARHTAATLLLEAGVDPRTLTQLMGHSSIAVSRAYQHVSTALATDALERVSRALTS